MLLELSVVTENAYTLQYKSKKTEGIEGPAAELVEKVLNTAGIHFTTQVLPWARAYKEAEKHKNTLIYSMVRTPERESKFHWLGEISKPQYYLFALKESKFLASDSINMFKEHRIGTHLNSASYLTLKAEGFNNLVPLSKANQIFRMLRTKRVDFITVNKRTFQSICELNNIKCDGIVPIAAIKLPDSASLYFAMNKKSDLALVNLLKVTYEKLKATGEISVF